MEASAATAAAKAALLCEHLCKNVLHVCRAMAAAAAVFIQTFNVLASIVTTPFVVIRQDGISFAKLLKFDLGVSLLFL